MPSSTPSGAGTTRPSRRRCARSWPPHGSPYRAAVLERLELTADAVKWALPRLEATAEIEKVDRKRLIVDPLFAEWIAILNDGSAIGRDGEPDRARPARAKR